MNPSLFVPLGVLALVLIWIIATANRFVRLREHLRESWADIDVELKRRYDLIPNLVETVKGYARHERETLERVLELRNRAARNTGEVGSQGRDESALMLGVKQLFAVAEGSPDLKADRHFMELQRQLGLTEDRIAAARRFYNGNVRTLNVLRESLPTNLVAHIMGVEEESFFELRSDAERVVPRITLSE